MSRDSPGGESWTVPDRRDEAGSRVAAPLFDCGTVLVDRYELRRLLGRGGMGVVYEAYDRVLEQAIAVKVVRPEYAGDRTWAERLAREVKLARQINHPNVCRVFDFGIAEAHPFLTMELACGGTLRDEIAAGRMKERSLQQRAADARAIASGLAAIHAAGIIHRDVAPQNVLRMADGTLVLSDFGLATSRSDGTSSVHGGTVAYMAPEVVLGARSSVASDIWSVGAVIHECVFGMRPQWSDGTRDIGRPALGRRLLPAEEVVYQTCRACLSAAPAKRLKRAADVVRWLDRRRPDWRSSRMARAAAAGAAVVVLGVGLGLGPIASRRHEASALPVPAATRPMLALTGEAANWTDRSTVLAQVPDRIDCMVRLPDRETIRFVWGRPRHAEDVNIRTGKRTPSALVPEAFAEGCPDTTREGRVVFTGHTPEQRAFAFLSEHPDGRDAVPVAAMAQPSVLSDPVWFPDGDRFQYEADQTHAAVYSVSTKESTILAPQGDFLTMFASVSGGRSILAAVSFDFTTEVQVFSSPFVGPDVRFRVPFFVTRVESPGGGVFMMGESSDLDGGRLIVVDAAVKQARAVGVVPGQSVRYPLLLDGALAFLTMKLNATLAIRGRDEVPVSTALILAARCGSDIVAAQQTGTHRSLVRIDEQGRVLGYVNVEGEASIPECSPDGRTLYYLADQKDLRRCAGAACVTIASDVFGYSLSPDGARLAVFTTKNPPLGLVIVDADGGHRTPLVIRNPNPCRPSWQTRDLLWVSVRHGPSSVWEQRELPSGKPTGRTAPGQLDCTDGREEVAPPFPPEIRILDRLQYQLRVIRDVPGIDLADGAGAQPGRGP